MQFDTCILSIDYDESQLHEWKVAYKGCELALKGQTETITVLFHSGNPSTDWGRLLDFIESNGIPKELVYSSSSVDQFGRDWPEFANVGQVPAN